MPVADTETTRRWTLKSARGSEEGLTYLDWSVWPEPINHGEQVAVREDKVSEEDIEKAAKAMFEHAKARGETHEINWEDCAQRWWRSDARVVLKPVFGEDTP